ncbi:M48 family metalloprotease [Pseudomonas sp. N040]|uniref:M48 family metalloprotease n=1 Tax=Pseudomonas sp. N040 TaxID=2785325 RepID=UPI0018A2679A|nr:M48 family metalloprotease [Pseudomonas sp. N040]MBF7729890.1 M48 family metalloprotease [Pseudomonas sp. N040]MBW7013532.1 M48 family metalloprotease [Pseudomonas sp. N040]
MNIRVVLALLCAVAGISGCAVNPVTGNSDFVMMTEQQELSLGRQSYQQVLKQYPIYQDEKLRAYVQQVGEKLASNSHRSNLQYQFFVVDSADINAFALPGGYVFINRGLLAYLNSEAEMAAVLGHEIGHVTARHGVRQQSQAQAWNILGQAVAIGTGVGAAGDLTNVLGNAIVTGYGRDMELEADGLGAQYLARSDYNPEAMIEVVEVLKTQDDFARDQAQKNGQPVKASGYHGLFDTHPDNDTRLKQVIGPARALASGQQLENRQAFLKHLEGLPLGDSAEQGVRRGQQFFHAGLDFTLGIPQGWELLNRPDAVVIHTADQQAFVALKMGEFDARLTPEEMLRKQVGDQRLAMQESFQRDGLSGVTAVIPGQPARRVALIVKGQQVYMFIGVVKAPGSLESEDNQFMAVINSFRALTAKEKALAQPVRIHVVQVKPGETLESLAGSADLPGDKVARIRLLNGLYPSGEVAPGSMLKLAR